MTSPVLARKHRPRVFAEMVGQEPVVQALANALTSQRLHHAYLFTGTRGVGKTTVSRILAKSLNCTGPEGQGGITATPCGVCPACRDIDAGRFPDYTELDAASNRGVDEVTQLLEQAVYKPVVGRFKVFMIDEVHMLTGHAFNAMLKTLEEPPEYLKFVLATTDPQKLPPTVLSRCLQFNLRPMAPETVFAHLQTVLAAEALEADVGALKLIARAAHGSMRDALSLTDQAIAFGAGALRESEVRQMLGAVGRASVFALLDALAAADGAALVAAVDTLRAQGLSAEGALEEMAVVLQELAVAQQVPATLDGEDPEAAALAARVDLLPADELQLLYSIALHGRGELALAPDEYGGLVMVLLRMLAFRPASARPGALKPPTAAPRASSAAAPPARVEAAISVAAAPLVRAGTTAVATSPLRSKPVSPPSNRSEPKIAAAVLHAGEPASPTTYASTAARAAATHAAVAPPSAAASVPPWEEDVPFEEEEHLVPAAPAVLRAAPSEPIVAEPALATTASGDRWAELVRALLAAEAISAMPRALAMQSQCVEIDALEQHIVLRTDSDSLRNPAHAQKLQAALAQRLGHAVEIEVQAGAVTDSLALRDTAEQRRRQAEAERAIHDDPLVVQLTARYPGSRIVPGTVKPI
jgi:DNA polymerase III subunit gamma/tau